MANLKSKVIGVLREREEVGNSNNKAVLAGVVVATGAVAAGGAGAGGGGADGGGGGGAGGRTVAGIVRQLPKMSALDLAGILNCRRRLEWTKEWLKKNQTEFLSKENLLKEIQFRSNETYHLNCFFDITERQFRYLVTKLAPVISLYEPHRRKKSFSAEERIAITLKYLATGEFHSCRNYCFRASKPVILKMISDICLNFYELLKDQYLSLPKTDEQWQNIANELQRRHRLPNCLGILSMRQMQFHTTSRNDEEPDYATKAPLIFTAIVDGDNNFTYVNVERTTARAHEQIYEYSSVKLEIETNALSLPAAVHEQHAHACYFAGCGALPVKPYLLNSLYSVPTSKDMSNSCSKLGTSAYAYCCAMDMVNVHVDNALRMLSNIFPILAQPLRMDEHNAHKITLGCVALYNFLRKTDRAFYKRTEKMNTHPEHVGNDDEDDDCILVANEEEQREREEYTPNVVLTTCFQSLRKQGGDTAAGLAKRKRLMDLVTESMLLL